MRYSTILNFSRLIRSNSIMNFKTKRLDLKAIKNVLHTNSNGTAESRLKTRYELKKTIETIN